jgi:hypothetical protein
MGLDSLMEALQRCSSLAHRCDSHHQNQREYEPYSLISPIIALQRTYLGRAENSTGLL